MPENIGGLDFVRPPMLEMKKKNETKEYKEYSVTTFRTPQDRNSTNSDDPAHIFTSVTDSMIFCNEEMTIQMPKKKFMIKNGKHKFAYAFGMFPFPKTGKAAYLDGCILGALGLKRQGVNADVICFVTPDINLQDRMKLAVVFDDVIRVPYISPYDMPDDGQEDLQTIKMDPKIFDNCNKYTKMHPYTHVFFKLHIFNPDLFPYEKVCFVDSDLVPMNYYDSLFMLETPAGWVEYRKKFPYKDSYAWDRCDFLKHGKKIPKIFTDVDTPGGADVNAGLLVVTPNKKEYNSMINQITSPLESWMGPDKLHKGYHDFNFDNPIGQKFVPNSYCYPEQNYLTKRYSGKWTFIEFAFQSWSLDPCNSFGIHMAAFNPKPWFKQPAGTEVVLKDKPKPYVRLFDDEGVDSDIQTPVEIPQAVAMFDENKNYENISISYELFNDVIIWGLVNYPDLHTFFMGEAEVHGSKVSFDRDIFKPLSKEHQYLYFKDIKKGSSIYKRLSMSQKYICNLIQDYETFMPQIKDKYTSICKTKMFDRYGNYNVNFTMVTYPGVKDIYEKEETILLENKLMPFGKFKGKPINDMEDSYMKEFMNMKGFKQNKKIRQHFRKTKFRDLMKDEKDYKDMIEPSKTKSKSKSESSKSKSTSKKGKLRKRGNKKTTRKSKKSLYYFYMDNCSYCKKFNPTWVKLVKEFKSKVTMKKINGPTNEKLMETYNVTSFPTIILIDGKGSKGMKVYNGDRSMKDMKKFLK